MKTRFLIPFMLCCTLSVFAQVKQHRLQTKPTGKSGNNQADPDSWQPGTLAFNDARGNLELDTSLFTNGGFDSLRVQVTSSKPTEFKFKRDKFYITTLNDFRLDYFVKRTFQAGVATLTLYLYSGSLIIYKRDYSITFDGRLNPTLIIKPQ